MKEGLESCKSLAEQLGKPYTAMSIGKVRKQVCDKSDMDGKFIKPEGVYKICQFLKKDIYIRETATPETVWVRVLHHQTGNASRLWAEDLETKKKVSVIVPKNRKRILNIKGKKWKVARGISNGEYVYRYPSKV